MNTSEVRKLLYASVDVVHKDFNPKIITTVSKERFIGVLTPKLREIARNMVKNDSWHKFIADVPHSFFEENQLHVFIISEIPDFDFAVHAVDDFLPYIDNWATCDQMSPKVFAKNPEKLLPYIEKWINSKHVYTVRFGVLCLMRYFLEEKFDEKYADMVVNTESNEYYVNMARAWYFATGAAKQFDRISPYFERLDDWTKSMAIEKSLESYRVKYINKLKLKRIRKKGKK